MARICCVTVSATYQGALDLKSTSGQQMRLLDALNTPQRLDQPTSIGETSLLLEGGVRKDHSSGRVEPFQELSLRLSEVLAAYELVVDAEDESRRVAAMKDATLYEQRTVTTQSEPIRIYLPNGWRVEGSVRPGRQVLHELRKGRPFVPILDVRILDPTPVGGEKSFPFLALNVLRIEAVSE
jgi:hypothetical protein